jgi:Peroxisomal biogenesis factor 11 (PEX11)
MSDSTIPSVPTSLETNLDNEPPPESNDFKKNITLMASSGESSSQSMQQLRLPRISLEDGFRGKRSFGLHAWNHTLSTLDGRDNITKLLQCFCRVMAWWICQQSDITQNQCDQINNSIGRQLAAFFVAERFASMKTSLATSRKAFRLGRSMVEIQKLQSLGIMSWFDHYLQSCLAPHSKDLTRDTKSILHSLVNLVYNRVYHPLRMNLRTKSQINVADVPFWNIAGNSIKSLGMLMFCAADNLSFLVQSGFLDDYRRETHDRLQKRAQYVSMSTNIANRSYFVAAMAGLVTNWITYRNYTTKAFRKLQEELKDLDSNEALRDEVRIALQNGLKKRFTLFLTLMKSICDVLVFSNNPGVDIWKRYGGRSLHEGLHCLCEMVSASVVLYNNYPNISDIKQSRDNVSTHT